jgi:DNA invertase Pin-like site-specific DNA recombinase
MSKGTTNSVRVALYLRVSTAEQTTENQRLELERVAAARAWTVVKVYRDEGISGAKGRDGRPGFDGALKGAVRGEFDMLMAWDVSRLGRSLADRELSSNPILALTS